MASDRIEVSVADLAAALEEFGLMVRTGGFARPLATVRGTVADPDKVADVLFRTLSAHAAHREPPATKAHPVAITVTAVQSPSGLQYCIQATWPAARSEGWYVALYGADGSYGKRDWTTKPRWAWTGFIDPGTHWLHVEDFEAAPFEVPPAPGPV